MNTCPFCGESLDRDHILVSYVGDAYQGRAIWECLSAGGCFTRHFYGRDAAEATMLEYAGRQPDGPDRHDPVLG